MNEAVKIPGDVMHWQFRIGHRKHNQAGQKLTSLLYLKSRSGREGFARHTKMVAARTVLNRDADLMPPEPGDDISEAFQGAGWLLGCGARTLGPVGRNAAIIASQPRQLGVFTRVSVNIAGYARRRVVRVEVAEMGLISLGVGCLRDMIRGFSHGCKRGCRSLYGIVVLATLLRYRTTSGMDWRRRGYHG
jgi:hypothetical protein